MGKFSDWKILMRKIFLAVLALGLVSICTDCSAAEQPAETDFLGDVAEEMVAHMDNNASDAGGQIMQPQQSAEEVLRTAPAPVSDRKAADMNGLENIDYDSVVMDLASENSVSSNSFAVPFKNSNVQPGNKAVLNDTADEFAAYIDANGGESLYLSEKADLIYSLGEQQRLGYRPVGYVHSEPSALGSAVSGHNVFDLKQHSKAMSEELGSLKQELIEIKALLRRIAFNK